MLRFARDSTKNQLWWPSIEHYNYIRTIWGHSISGLLRRFPLEHLIGINHREVMNFKFYSEPWEYDMPIPLSESLDFSGYWFILFDYICENCAGISIRNWRLESNDSASPVTNNLWLLYYAMQPIDLVLSSATNAQLLDDDWIDDTRKKLLKLASLPDKVQKAVTMRMWISDLISHNVFSLLKWGGFLSPTWLRVKFVLEWLNITQLIKWGKYWICPAVFDGSLEDMYTQMVRIYREWRTHSRHN